MAICVIFHRYFQQEWDEGSTPLASWTDNSPFALRSSARIIACREASVKASVLSDLSD